MVLLKIPVQTKNFIRFLTPIVVWFLFHAKAQKVLSHFVALAAALRGFFMSLVQVNHAKAQRREESSLISLRSLRRCVVFL